MGDIQQVENFAYGEVDDVLDGFGVEVEAWIGGTDGGASKCECAHVFDVDEAQRHLAVADDQRSAFFECDHGGAGEEV